MEPSEGAGRADTLILDFGPQEDISVVASHPACGPRALNTQQGYMTTEPRPDLPPPPRHTHTQYTPSIVHDGAVNSVCSHWGQRLAVGRPRAAHLLHLCDPASAPEAACGFSSSVIQAIKSHPPPHRAATLTVPHERALSPKTPCVNEPYGRGWKLL